MIEPRTEAFYLGEIAAALHCASGGRGVVIVSSWGFEDLCAHRALVALADDLASLGCPALRLDLWGTGDSGGEILGAEIVHRWVDDILRAADWLRTHLGCTEISVVGLRLGALLAMQAAQRADFESVVLLAPPRNGRVYIRELTVLSRVIDRDTPPRSAAAFELAGFKLPPPALASISALRADGALRTRRLLNAGSSPEPPLPESLSTEGLVVTQMTFEGYDALMCDPTAGVVPRAFLTRVAEFIVSKAPRQEHSAKLRMPRAVLLPACAEEMVRVSPQRWGVYCSGPEKSEAIVLLNAGGVRRTGWARIWVDAARKLAPAGVSTLRLDLSHLDPPEKGAREDFTACYRERLRHEVTQAVEWLASRGYTRIGVAGLCSGAYQALQAGLLDSRVTRLILINQLCYEWTGRDALPLLAWVHQKSIDVRTRRQAEDDEESSARRLGARAYFAISRLVKASLRSGYALLRSMGRPQSSSRPAEWLNALSARGAIVDIVLSAGDASVDVFENVLGERIAGCPRIRVTTIENADHLLTPQHARDTLIEVLGRSERSGWKAAA